MNNILVIGDAHIVANQDLTRFRALGEYIKKTAPNYVIIIGDFLTMEALSGWDRNKRKLMEGKRYWKEIDTGQEALDLMLDPVRKSRKKMPTVYYVEGNHENRLERYLEINPEFDDLEHMAIDINLGLYERNIIYVPYKSYVEINGICFTHIPIAKNGRAISGVNICKKALQNYSKSVVFGHTHCLNIENMYRTGSDHLQQALNVGCFFEHYEPYIIGAPSDYWRGVVLLRNYDYMRFDIETVSLRRVLEYTP